MLANLALKYRPEVFEDLKGQEVIIKYLSSLIKKGFMGRNIIISGPYGSGKSSSCRIYARALNCLSPTISGSPCNKCENCLSFFKSEFPDYLEIDGASRGGIDAIKELVEYASTPPLFGRKRVINIDECFDYNTKVELEDGSFVKIGSSAWKPRDSEESRGGNVAFSIKTKD